MRYLGTNTSAQKWAENGKLEAWVHAYLLSDGQNQAFSEGLKLTDRIFLGPRVMPLALFRRCCGPEENMLYRVDASWWEKRVQALQAAAQSDADLPPLIVHYLIPEGQTEGVFELNDGNKRWEAYTRLGIREASVIVWITEPAEYEHFQKHFG